MCQYTTCRADRLSYKVTSKLRNLAERPPELPKATYLQTLVSVYEDDSLNTIEQLEVASKYAEKGEAARKQAIKRARNA